nr:hypothetical protein P5621_02355 [Bacillus subtilis]
MIALHFGAGNIGRGFIGALLHHSGYDVVFADVNDTMVSLLNEKKNTQWNWRKRDVHRRSLVLGDRY